MVIEIKAYYKGQWMGIKAVIVDFEVRDEGEDILGYYMALINTFGDHLLKEGINPEKLKELEFTVDGNVLNEIHGKSILHVIKKGSINR